MERLTRWVLAHRRLVGRVWIVITLVGIATSGAATKAMDQKFTVPGREGWETNQEIAQALQAAPAATPRPLVRSSRCPPGKRRPIPPCARDLQGARGRRSPGACPGARIAGYGSTGDKAFVSKDGRTAFARRLPAARPGPAVRRQPRRPRSRRAPRWRAYGRRRARAPDRLRRALADQSGDSDGPGVLVEALLGGFGALIVLAFVFGSFLAIVPLLMAIPAIMTSFLAVYGLTTFTDVSPIVQFLIALIGLGVAIDYALIIVVRWREELAHGARGRRGDRHGRWGPPAGRWSSAARRWRSACWRSSCCRCPFLRSVGYGGMLIPLVSVLVALTLLPVVLHSWGQQARLAAPAHRRQGLARLDRAGPAAWSAAAGSRPSPRCWSSARSLVAAHRHPARASPTSTRSPRPATPRTAWSRWRTRASAPARCCPTRSSCAARSAGRVADGGGRGRRHPRRGRARAPRAGARAAPRWSRPSRSPTARRGAARDLVDDGARRAAHGQGPDVKLGGQPASNDDFIDAVYGNFPLMIALIAIVTFILLARAFRSLLLPAKAVILNVISVAAAWGVMTLVWQEGHGSDEIWGIAATGAITSWIPLMVFAFLFGLSMDYEVFILARMREEYDATGDTDEAVIRGIGRTGRLVTSAALILFLAFVSHGLRARDRRQGAGHRPGGRHPARRDDHPRAAGARPWSRCSGAGTG